MRNLLLNSLACLSFLSLPLTVLANDSIQNSTEIIVNDNANQNSNDTVNDNANDTVIVNNIEAESSDQKVAPNSHIGTSTFVVNESTDEIEIADYLRVVSMDEKSSQSAKEVTNNSKSSDEKSYLLSDEEVALANGDYENAVIHDDLLSQSQDNTTVKSGNNEQQLVESETPLVSEPTLVVEPTKVADAANVSESTINSEAIYSANDEDLQLETTSKTATDIAGSDTDVAELTFTPDATSNVTPDVTSTAIPNSTSNTSPDTAVNETQFVVNFDEDKEHNEQLADNDIDTQSQVETESAVELETEAQTVLYGNEQILIDEEDEETQQTCESFFDLAATVMVARQKDVSIQLLLDAANVTFINSPQEESDTFIHNATTNMIELAYEFDIVEIDEQQELAKQFAYDVYAGCMELADRYSSIE